MLPIYLLPSYIILANASLAAGGTLGILHRMNRANFKLSVAPKRVRWEGITWLKGVHCHLASLDVFHGRLILGVGCQ